MPVCVDQCNALRRCGDGEGVHRHDAFMDLAVSTGENQPAKWVAVQLEINRLVHALPLILVIPVLSSMSVSTLRACA